MRQSKKCPLRTAIPMRIYCPPKNITSSKIIISDKKQLHHLAAVMRHKQGDRLFVFDGESKEYECKICTLAKDRAELSILSVKEYSPAKGPSISLACAMPKKTKMDYIIEKATELGVERIIPLKTQRTIVELSPERLIHKLSHWQNIINEASKQSARIRLPQLEPVSSFKNAIREAKAYDLALIPHLGAGNRHIKDVVSNFRGKSAIVFIGPEGDFTEREISLAKAYGCVAVSLGENVLKVDTAAIAVVAFLRFSV